MAINIFPIPLGFDCGYIIQDKGTIMIDGGEPKKIKEFKRGIEGASISPDEIKLMILTHGHWDHIGLAKEVKDLTNAKIAMHQKEKEWLEKSLKPLCPGVTLWSRIIIIIERMFLPLVHIPSTDVDIVLSDEEFPLAEYGISGKVIYTPGHSSGSVSVLLETGDVFVGDLAINKFPLCFSPRLPIFAEDWPKVLESWHLLLEQGAKTVYPAHGKPFSVDIIRKALFLVE
jgi:glyoxylase-like metal-dependent hydrolase (beta-lactamase superfamily II)